ncbi:MAG TPA: ImmA/IrrE family metallo-endopeptidase [Terracidiphilus sp.]|jgi:Zn-dependent peptidase ImmA (M78 family)
MTLNPRIVTWARETAGLSIEEAAHALGFKDSKERSARERLEAIELGQEDPSRSVLLNMARAYRRPLLVFYLSEPPRTGDRGQDFRRAPGSTPEYDPTLDALIRDIRARQGIVRDLRDQSDATALKFIGSAKMTAPPVDLAMRIVKAIGFSLSEFRRQTTVHAAFGYLREKVEGAGVFVVLLGNLGSYHTNIPSSVFRGYAIADPVAPFIVVNDQDAPIAWTFTALHELVHLWLGTTGVSGSSSDTEIESYCNSVAGEMLLPEAEMNELQFLRRVSLEETIGAISGFARVRNVSRGMVAYKLLRVNIINHSTWRELDSHYHDEWIASHAQVKAGDRSEGGPSYYVVKRHRLGQALLDLVRNSLAEGFLTPTKAGRVLGVKARNVDPLIYAEGMRGGS